SSILVSIFLINVEVTIVSTSLVAIATSLHGFDKTSWIVTGYLISYMGFMLIWAKVSDIIGRKYAFISTMTIFTVFSGACGGAKTMEQLIIFRCFQGVGGSGGFAITMLMTWELVPKEKIPLYSIFISVTYTVTSLMGPLLGGAINERTTWRWIFYFNAPIGAVTIVLLAIAIPASFPYRKEDVPPRTIAGVLRDARKLDFFGALLLLAGSLLLSTVLLDTSIRTSWSSSTTITLLVLVLLSWACFFPWEWLVSAYLPQLEPMFPWVWMSNRPWLAMLLSNILWGAPFNVMVVFIPQRLQIVSGFSALSAGLRILPYVLSATIGGGLSMAASKQKVSVVNVLLYNAVLQITGVALLSTLPNTTEWPRRAYGYMVPAGLGMGGGFAMLSLTTGVIMQGPHLGSAAGTIGQFRFLGGVIGLAIATNVFSSHLSSHLGGLIPRKASHSVQETINILGSLSPEVRTQVLRVVADGYNLQMKAMNAFTAAQLPAIALIWNRKWSHVQ
ncbi:MFS general substrate transporter, partial [Byssothecium circinans]